MTDTQTICIASVLVLCNLTTCLTVAGCLGSLIKMVRDAIAKHDNTSITKVIKIGVKQK